MLIIGHRGSRGTHSENSIAALREAIAADADMIEFDVRLTKDNVPILSHDMHLYRTHKKTDLTARNTLAELQKLTSGSEAPIVTLEQALKECYGKIFINIEVKRMQPVLPILEVLQKFYKRKKDWESLLVSSFSPHVLRKFRKHQPDIQLGMLQHLNPVAFIPWQRQLNLAAIGFHRLHVNGFALRITKELGLFTYCYTVNRIDTALRLERRGIDAIVTDYPRQMISEFSKAS